jgi:hypothetical protein
MRRALALIAKQITVWPGEPMFESAPDTAFSLELDNDVDSHAPVATYPLLHCPPLARGLSVALVGLDDSGEKRRVWSARHSVT